MKKIISVVAVFFCLLWCMQLYAKDIHGEELRYLEYKGRLLHEKAIDQLLVLSKQLTDSAMRELNALRIHELTRFPELYNKGIAGLRALRKQAESPFLHARVDHLLSRLLLHNGDLRQAQKLVASFGFLCFHITGPFAGASTVDFNKQYGPLKKVELSGYLNGKVNKTGWFRATPGRDGVIDTTAFMNQTRDSFFYLYTEFMIKENSVYTLLLGKTGYTDVWLDGIRVYTNRKKHGFSHDQYLVSVRLKRGRHRLLVKTGDRFGDCRFSMRIADENGRRLIVDNKNTGPFVQSGTKVLSSQLVPSLNNLLKKKKKTGADFFRIGQMYYLLNMASGNNRETLHYLAKVPLQSRYRPSAVFYTGEVLRHKSQQEACFRAVLKRKPAHLEAMRRLVEMKLNNNYFSDAYHYIQLMKQMDGNSPVYYSSLASFYRRKNWDFLMLQLVDRYKKNMLPSARYALLETYYRNKGIIHKAAKFQEKLYQLDNFNKRYVYRLARSYKRLGLKRQHEQLLLSAMNRYPADVSFALRLAGYMERLYGPVKAVPVLSSALQKAPENERLLRSIGLMYHKLNKRKVALYYLQQAIARDPDNFALRRYYHLIQGKKKIADGFRLKHAIARYKKEAFAFRHEPVVVLLDERVITINADGSYEKHVRKIVKINDPAHARDFTRQYIIYEPGTEHVENITCTVITNNTRREVSGRYTRSLSDPASRLYYNMKALIVPVVSLRAGSIIDFSYTLVNSAGREYKNYFGEKMIIGSRYRTLHTNFVVTHPPGKKIYCHIRRLPKNKLRIIQRPEHDIFIIRSGNQLPYKKEDAMPHRSEVLPTVYFTSFKNWKTFHDWYRSLLKDKIICSAEMRAELNRVIKQDDTDAEKIRKIYNLVTSTIRYVGFEFGVGGIEPRRSDLTFQSKMGDCKDMALVLVALLREADVPAGMALIRTRENGKADLTVPFMGEFNHAICHTKVDGKDLFLDATSAYSGFRELPVSDRGVMTMVLHGNGFEFLETKGSVYIKNVDSVINTVSVDDSGTAVIQRKLIKSGTNAIDSRYSLVNVEKKLNSVRSYWNKKFPGSRIGTFNIINSDKSGSVSYRYSVAVPSFARVTKDEIIFPAFIMPSDFYASVAMFRKRRFPVVFAGPETASVSIVYSVPKGYSVYHLPKSGAINHKKFSAGFSYEVKGRNIYVKSVIRVKHDRVKPGQEYAAFRKFARFISRKERERIVLVRE